MENEVWTTAPSGPEITYLVNMTDDVAPPGFAEEVSGFLRGVGLNIVLGHRTVQIITVRRDELSPVGGRSRHTARRGWVKNFPHWFPAMVHLAALDLAGNDTRDILYSALIGLNECRLCRTDENSTSWILRMANNALYHAGDTAGRCFIEEPDFDPQQQRSHFPEVWEHQPRGEDYAYMLRRSIEGHRPASLGGFSWPQIGFAAPVHWDPARQSGLYGILNGLGDWAAAPLQLQLSPEWKDMINAAAHADSPIHDGWVTRKHDFFDPRFTFQAVVVDKREVIVEGDGFDAWVRAPRAWVRFTGSFTEVLRSIRDAPQSVENALASMVHAHSRHDFLKPLPDDWTERQRDLVFSC